MHDERTQFAATSQPASHRRAPASLTKRSKITNSDWRLPDCDNRLPAARRFRDICRLYAGDAGGDLTEAEKAQVRQAALLTLRCEALQAAQVKGELVDDDEAIRLSSEIRRILAALNARAAKNKPAPPTSLQELLAREESAAS
jgi:hypothetical protein